MKILILTTFDDDEYVLDALHNGASGFVLKNIEPSDLVLAVQAVNQGVLYVSPSVGVKLIDNIRTSAGDRQELHGDLIARISARLPQLTLREAEILALIIRAERNQEIADKLFITEKTVKNHISNIYDKLRIHNRLRLISYVADLGITPLVHEQ